MDAGEIATPPAFNEERFRKNRALALTLFTIFSVTYFTAALLTSAEFKEVAAFEILGIPLAVLLGMLVLAVGLGVTLIQVRSAVQR